ncbi:MAG: hypothetical protein U0636_11415 [Phycisphaerales bacterium]
MRVPRLSALLVVLGALVAVVLAEPGCRSNAGSAGEVAAVPEGPRNAAALQAEPPAASAMRGGGEIEKIAEGQVSSQARPASPAQLNSSDWSLMTESFNLFRHGPYVLDVMLGFLLSILLALLLTAWPRSLVPHDPVAAAEERNGGVIVSMVGCLAAELVQSSEHLTMGAEIALVVFGIGGLIRFRTVFGDPRRTGLMILITILGLCCGMSQYALASLAFVVIWFVRYLLLSRTTLVVRVRTRKGTDVEQARAAAVAAVSGRGATIFMNKVRRDGRTVELQAYQRGSIDETDLRETLEDAIPGARVRVSAS